MSFESTILFIDGLVIGLAGFALIPLCGWAFGPHGKPNSIAKGLFRLGVSIMPLILSIIYAPSNFLGIENAVEASELSDYEYTAPFEVAMGMMVSVFGCIFVLRIRAFLARVKQDEQRHIEHQQGVAQASRHQAFKPVKKNNKPKRKKRVKPHKKK